jgi:hypothetical protein
LLQAGVTAGLYWGRWADPEYGWRLGGLQKLRAAGPARPLVVLLGSSRVAMGLRPAVLDGGPPSPLVFNFAQVGSGPVMQLWCLKRLLADGVRPDWVLFEYWPAFACQEGPCAEETHLDVNRLGWRDLPLLSRYSAQPRRLYRTWWEAQLAPAFSHRFLLLSQYAPRWLPYTLRMDISWSELDAYGWLPAPVSGAAGYAARVRKARNYYEPVFSAYHFSAQADRAVRELVVICRRQGIKVAGLYLPEAAFFRDWYQPVLGRQIDTYLGRLRRECAVPVIDLRGWCAEKDFVDGFHLHPEGARAFTQRFGREVLGPLLRGRE